MYIFAKYFHKSLEISKGFLTFVKIFSKKNLEQRKKLYLCAIIS